MGDYELAIRLTFRGIVGVLVEAVRLETIWPMRVIARLAKVYAVAVEDEVSMYKYPTSILDHPPNSAPGTSLPAKLTPYQTASSPQQ